MNTQSHDLEAKNDVDDCYTEIKILEQLPCPKPDLSVYEKERELALSRSVDTKINYEQFLRSCRSETINYSPVRIDIENVSRCNFRCQKCQVSLWQGGRRAKDMSFDIFKGILDILSGILEMKIQGMGEPVLQGVTFFKMIEHAREKHIWVRTTTNASILHINDNYMRLIDVDPNEVQISIDGTHKETFERIRAGSNFETVSKNCKLINGYCNARGLLKTRMWVCLEQTNISEFLDFVKLASSLGFRRLSFALNLHGWGSPSHLIANRRKAIENLMNLDMAMEAVTLGQRLGVDVSFWNNIRKYQARNSESVCPWPFERAFISSDGKIVPCCMIGNPDTADFGEILDFEQIWFGKTYQDFRRSHLQGTPPEFCQPCYTRQLK